jgi:murein L,D-transpeptidase YafK
MVRSLIFLLIFCIFSCNQNAQNNNFQVSDKLSGAGFDEVTIDTVADIAKGTNELSTTFIKKRLQALVGQFLKEKCIENGIKYPPQFIIFRCFKYEKEFEVWAANSRSESLKRIFYCPICAVDNQPGTKLQMGDGKTPEGFYNSALQYGSPNGFMWIRLNNSEIDTYGTPGYGSSFKMCLDYPNALDKKRTSTLLKGRSPGSAICVHANCVTAGCISFKNRNYLPIFLAALNHDSKVYGAIKIYIFPFRFDEISESNKEKLAENVSDMKKEQVIEAWKNMEEGYNLFNKTRKALKINIVNNTKYSYLTY